MAQILILRVNVDEILTLRDDFWTRSLEMTEILTLRIQFDAILNLLDDSSISHSEESALRAGTGYKRLFLGGGNTRCFFPPQRGRIESFVSDFLTKFRLRSHDGT